jgi:hypothetical protein
MGSEEAGITEYYSARFAENGDWLRGAKRCGIGRNVTATVPVPFFRRQWGGGPSPSKEKIIGQRPKVLPAQGNALGNG